MEGSSSDACDRELLAALARPESYPGSPEVLVCETHASIVFLAGNRAYKLKKPVKLDFLDYSTPERRRAACREEVRVNRELAPDVYLGVRAIVKTREGLRFAAQDTPGASEYAVEMRRFADADTLAGAIAARDGRTARIEEVAGCLAAFHRRTPALAGGGAGDVLRMWRANLTELAGIRHPDHWRVDALESFGRSFVRVHAHEIERRVAEGCVRDVHGDVRCEHVLLEASVQIVDRIEFDPALRRADVAFDLAFLTADLLARRRSVLARELVAAYRRAGGSPGSEALRSFYAAHCALVRAKVALIAGGRARAREAERLWRLAERLCWQARRPLALVVCGPAATGKSTLARELARRSGFPVVSSDEVRKRLAGIDASARGRPEHYSEQFTRATYDRLSREALALLDRHGAAIVDATCLSRRRRALLLHRLHTPAARLLVVRCRLPLASALAHARDRVREESRTSDATPRIVAEQYSSFEEPTELPSASVLQLPTDRPLDEQVADVAEAVDALRTDAEQAEVARVERRPT